MVRADLTVTFGTHKPGLLIDPAREYAGSVRLVDIGLPLPGEAAELEALQHPDVARLLPVPAGESDKYRRGVVGIAAGSARYPGAAVLAVAGALRGGAGAVRYVGPAGDAVIARFPETLVSDQGPKRAGRVQAWVVGPGAGDDAATVAQVLAAEVPVLIDADGLRLADADAVRARTAPTLMTPHAGEAAALLGVGREEVEAARLDSVRELAARYGATVLLKGSTTLVARAKGGPVRVNATGTSWLATAGSGDVLSGLAGSLLAAGLSAVDAGSVGAYLHGLAGRFAAEGPRRGRTTWRRRFRGPGGTCAGTEPGLRARASLAGTVIAWPSNRTRPLPPRTLPPRPLPPRTLPPRPLPPRPLPPRPRPSPPRPSPASARSPGPSSASPGPCATGSSRRSWTARRPPRPGSSPTTSTRANRCRRPDAARWSSTRANAPSPSSR